MTILPDSSRINARGHLEIGGCDMVEVARQFGTPLYVLDAATIKQRCQDYTTSFARYHKNTEIIYASKALCTVAVLQLVNREGLGVDVSSSGELFTAIKAKSDLKKVYFHGNNKSREELKFALDAGVGKIVVDNLDELKRLDALTREEKLNASILLRVNPGIEAHTHDYIKTGTLDSKFGFPAGQLEAAVSAARQCQFIHLTGLHAHIGSQIFDVRPFCDETQLLLDLVRKYGLQELDIGGGIGIPYVESDTLPSLDDFARQITSVLKDNPRVKLILEPGRSIIGQAGVTLYTIGGIKDIPGMRKYVFVDGGMADNPRPILYQAKYTASVANKASQPKNNKVTIAGRFCESGDVLIKDAVLSEVAVGDILVVFSTGAYNYAMASNYNRVCRPAMVMVHKDKAHLIVKRETFEDLVHNDVVMRDDEGR